MPGPPKVAIQGHCEVQHSVVPCKAEGIGGKCCEQARVEGQNPISPLQTLKVQESKRLLQPERDVTTLLQQL